MAVSKGAVPRALAIGFRGATPAVRDCHCQPLTTCHCHCPLSHDVSLCRLKVGPRSPPPRAHWATSRRPQPHLDAMPVSTLGLTATPLRPVAFCFLGPPPRSITSSALFSGVDPAQLQHATAHVRPCSPLPVGAFTSFTLAVATAGELTARYYPATDAFVFLRTPAPGARRGGLPSVWPSFSIADQPANRTRCIGYVHVDENPPYPTDNFESLASLTVPALVCVEQCVARGSRCWPWRLVVQSTPTRSVAVRK
jgi:hypothetical protein